ncbi:nucleotide-diphospho-sugar transferase, partial [Chytriomyces sp. MP71]
EYVAWSKTWLRHNPTYTHKLWSDDDNLRLITDHYGWFLPTYTSYAKPIMRADAARIFYMHHEGGVYSDFDVVALRPLDPLLANSSVVLASMWAPQPAEGETDYWKLFWWENQVPNAWFASVPGHPFWMHTAQLMVKLVEEGKEVGVEQLTGPAMLRRALLEFQVIQKNEASHNASSPIAASDPIHVAEPNAIFPYSWVWADENVRNIEVCSSRKAGFNERQCRRAVDPNGTSYAISYWSHSWDS